MKHHLSKALHALDPGRATRSEWSRLEQVLSGHPYAAHRLEAGLDHQAEQDTSEMRRYLAAQTAQTV